MSSKTIQDTLFPVRPTLYIGLGGAGKEVLLELRKNLLGNIWGTDGAQVKLNNLDQFPVAQFLYYDLEPQLAIDNSRSLSKESQINSIELSENEAVTGLVNWHEFIHDDNTLDKYPYIREWFPVSPKKLRELGLDIHNTRAPIRAISRLNFFDKFEFIKDKIRRQLFNLTLDIAQEQSLNRIGLTIEQSRPRIVVVASSAGVTGSGAFIDIGYLVNFLAQQVGIQSDVELMLFMPTAYELHKHKGIQANAYATLMELEAAMRGNNSFVSRWNNSIYPELGSTPYSEVYLLDNSNLAKQHTHNIENIYHMLAANLLEDFIPGDFVLRKRSVAVNQGQYKIPLYQATIEDKKFSKGCFSYSKSYSSFGQSILELKPVVTDLQKLNNLAAAILKTYFLNATELKNNHHDVIEMLAILENKNASLPTHLKTNSGTTLYIETAELTTPIFNESKLIEWATQALKGLCKSEPICEILASPQGRSQIVANVMQVAQTQLLAEAALLQQLSSTDATVSDSTSADPFISTLEKMMASSRIELFRKWLALAMPWVDVNLKADFALQPGQLKCLIAVANPQEFKVKFNEELNACLPTYTGITAEQLLIVGTSAKNRVICYTEISGLPLTVLNGIHGWRDSYQKESENWPLHTHIDVTQFAHPIAPTTQEVVRLANDFKYFLLAVMTHIVTRYGPKVVPSGQYQFAIAKTETRRIGNERTIRQNGLSKYYREAIIGRVNDFLEQADANCLVVLSALAIYYESQVYTPKSFLNDDGHEVFVKGFASVIARELSVELQDRAKQKGCIEPDINKVTQKLLEPKNLKLWAKTIPDSDTDAYKWEVREADFDNQPRVKMSILKELLAPGQMLPIIQSIIQSIVQFESAKQIAVKQYLDLNQTAQLPLYILQHQYYLGITGQQYGPFTAQQIIQMVEIDQLSLSCKVWRQGLETWTDLFEFPELANYLVRAAKGSIQPPTLE
jgi:hypothetical protein